MSNSKRTQTTWDSGSTWLSGQTKTIRIPVVLSAQIIDYARKLDSNNALSHGISADSILSAIDRYIEFRQQNFRPNQHSKKPDLSSRTWDELRKFQELVKENPGVLGVD